MFAICHRPPVYLSSVTFVRPTQAIESFSNVSTPFGTLFTHWHLGKIYGDRSRETPPSGELNTKGIAEYSDFVPMKRYISETVQDRAKLVLITNRKSHASFQLVPNLVTLDDLEQRNSHNRQCMVIQQIFSVRFLCGASSSQTGPDRKY